MEKEQQKPAIGLFSFKLTRRHLMVIGVLAIAFAIAFMLRSFPLQYGFYLNEFDPYFDYRATQFLVENGVDQYFTWHDTMSWYPEGREVAKTSQTGLHLSAAYLYKAFGGGAPLYDFVVWLPVVLGSLTVIVMFALVRVISNTTAGMFAALFFAFSPAIIQRGNLGWFKSEPLGLFLALLATYLFLSALKHNDPRFYFGKVPVDMVAIVKAIVGGLILGFAMTAWGGIQYFNLLLGLFFIAIPFFTKDIKPSIYVVPIFTFFTIIVASSFPRPGEDFAMQLGGLSLIGPTIFLIVAHFVKSFSKTNKLRNTLAWLGAFVIGSAVFVATGPYVSPFFRYISAINPFSKTEIPLIESVAEHFTPTIVDYFVDYSVLILLAGYGVMLCFRKRNDMTIFALILGITGIYVSASFTRLLVYASVAIITLASIALFEITTAMFTRTEAPPVQPKKKIKVQHYGKDFRIAYTVLIIGMLAVPVFYPPDASWIAGADFPPSIVNGATGFKVSTNDWTEMMSWIKNNTEPDAIIASWWDYGYWITTLGNRTSLADNATINMTRIEQMAKALVSDEQTGLKILKDLKADYVLVYVVGQRASLPQGGSFIILGGGGDESKKHWFMRIAGVDENQYIEDDGFTAKPLFWNNTLLGKMFPVQPAAYVRLDQQGRPVDLQPEYKTGYAPLYMEQITYPQNSTDTLRLVHASPSFMNKEGRLMLGVLLYEVLEEPIKPVEEPVAPAEPVIKPAIPGMEIKTRLEPLKEYAVLQMSVSGQNVGNITIQLFPDIAPQTVQNFEKLIDSGFYNGIKIHRIVPDFVIQGGDPNTKDKDRSTWGTGGPGYNVPAEISNMTHARGIVAMAHPGNPNLAGSQFYIVVKDAPHLDGKYTIFGKVVEGMDLVDDIVMLPRDENDIPINSVVIEKAYIIKTS
jgi:dolichyl-diphosphooligosaccharide--protein glycosyltransferase